MLSVAPDAPADEIKKAFRREIARYHPDKVQHLGPEFQDMAAGIAADLTEAYRVLMDPGLRAKYDAELHGPPASPVPGPRPPVPEPVPQPPPAAAHRDFATPPRPTAGLDFVRRAALSKIKEAVHEMFAGADPIPAPGFDVALVTRPKKGLFKKAEDSVCILIKFVAAVDPPAVVSVWGPASKLRAPGAAECAVILVGSDVAPARELAAAVTDLRRRARGTGPVLVPVDVRDWEALFPPETPGSVRSLIQRLKDGKQ